MYGFTEARGRHANRGDTLNKAQGTLRKFASQHVASQSTETPFDAKRRHINLRLIALFQSASSVVRAFSQNPVRSTTSLEQILVSGARLARRDAASRISEKVWPADKRKQTISHGSMLGSLLFCLTGLALGASFGGRAIPRCSGSAPASPSSKSRRRSPAAIRQRSLLPPAWRSNHGCQVGISTCTATTTTSMSGHRTKPVL